MDENLWFAEIKTLGRMLRRGQASSLELTRAFLDRLEVLGPRYNALAEPTRELALKQARKADRELSSGKDRGPLHGIPYGAKDLLDTAGIPTRWGSPAHRTRVPDADATVIRKLRDAGAVLIGKLAMVELAGGGGYTSPAASLHGPGLNPWNTKRWAGGSSSGSGSAVAAGLVPFALGSETIGSIVSPSAFCGVTGLRPTHGAVSRAGAMSLAWSMDKIGPMTHSSADCALVLSAIAGADPADATTEPWQYEPSSARKFRLGVPAFDLSKHPHMRRAFGRALSVLRGLGMGTRRVKLPQAQLGAMSWTFLGGEVAAAHEEFLRSPELDELVDEGQRAGLRSYLDQKASAYSRALLQRVGVARDVRALFAGVDAIVCPSYFNGAPRADQPLRRSLGRRRGGSGPDPTLGAVAGLPGLCLPIGFDKDGLPIAMTITGDRFAEATILRIGQLFQRETDWHQQHPRVR